eukprot:c29136_g3_i1 orf=1113-5150(+)
MGDGTLRNPWSWGVPTYDSRKSFDSSRTFEGSDDEEDDRVKTSGMESSTRRLSLPNMGVSVQSEFMKKKSQTQMLANKVVKLKDHISTVRDEVLELRQEASDLQEYSNAKIARVTRYLGVLAEKAHKLDQLALDSEVRCAFLRKDRKKLFNDLLSIKGNIRVFCRVRPHFEHEGPTATEFPDNFSIRVHTAGIETAGSLRKEFEFDRVFGPHVGQGDFFQDIQPLVQSTLDGYCASIFAYGQVGSGKTYTMEGPHNDRGIFFRAFEELFDLCNTNATPASSFLLYMTMFGLYNEQVQDLLMNTVQSSGLVRMGYGGNFIELSQQKVNNSTDFTRVYRMGMQNRAMDTEFSGNAHLVLTAHVHYTNTISGESQYSKLSMVDMVSSERLSKEAASGDRLTELLHINKSFSALGDVLSALTAKKDHVPYGNSKLTQVLADCLGGDSKTLLIVNISPSYVDIQETLASLHFAARARNVELSLGNRDTIKKWRDMANESRREVYEKEKVSSELQQEVLSLKTSLKNADDQCLMLFTEVQKAWKVAFTLQADHKTQSAALAEKQKLERDQNTELKNQVAQFIKCDQDQKVELQERSVTIQKLEGRVKELEEQLTEARAMFKDPDAHIFNAEQGKASGDPKMQRSREQIEMSQKLEEELLKRDELIERLHEENEKLFERLTDRSISSESPQVPRMDTRGGDNFRVDGVTRNTVPKAPAPLNKHSRGSSNIDYVSDSLATVGTVSLMKSNSEKIKTTPAGEYLTSALLDFNPDQYESMAAVADGANKLLMLVLAAVIKAGAAREHEMLAEIRGAVFSFIRKMEQRRVMDTMLVSRVRILYIRSLLSRAPELQSIKAPPVDRFLEKAGSSVGRGRSSSRGSSPARSPIKNESNMRKDLIEEHIQPFRVHLRQEKKSKFSSIVLKLRGIDQETWRQHVTGGKLRETTEEARSFAVGNKPLAALFVHTPAGELQRQIRGWLAENFDFLSVTGGDSVGGTAGQLELLSTAIMDGWMAGLGSPQRPSTDALGQLLSDYTKRVYTSQLQHLKDVAATLATEEADDLAQVTKLRSALESVEHKRRKVLQQMRLDVALLTKEEGGSPVKNPSTATEDARIASLMSLEDIVKQAEEIKRDAPQKATVAAKKKLMLVALNSLSERMPALLTIDHPCAQKHILDAQKIVESIAEQKEGHHHTKSGALGDEALGELPSLSGDWRERSTVGTDNDVTQWSILQFNNSSATQFVIKCGANTAHQLVVKAQAKLEDKTGKEIISVIPAPSTLAGLSLAEIKQVLLQLPEAFSQLTLARTADATRARYTRLYKTLAIRVPVLKSSVLDLEIENSREFPNHGLPFKKPLQ